MARWKLAVAAMAAVLGVWVPAAWAEVKIGVTLSATGPAATFGITERNLFGLMAREVAGQKVEYIILDDQSDPTVAVRNARRFVDEDKVDLVIGSSTSPNSLAIIDVVAGSGTPLIVMGSAVAAVEPVEGPRRWVFKSVQNDSTMMASIFRKIEAMGIKKLGYIGLADASADGWLAELQRLTSKEIVELVETEKYNRSDRSVVPQALRLVAARPQGIFISSSSTPAATPMVDLRQRGYSGPLFSTHGVASPDVIKIAGAAAEGLMIPTGPLIIAEQLPNTDPVKAVVLDIQRRYVEKFGAATFNTFVANAYDPVLMFQAALPGALQKAAPGTPAFRGALRDGIEGIRGLVGTQGVYDMSPTNHVGLDARSSRIVQLRGGNWVLMKDE